MTLIESYSKIKPAIVAFVPKFQTISHPDDPAPEFAPIFGTGFIVDEGIVATNDHVVKVIPKLPKPPDFPPDEWPVNCLLWQFIPDKGMATISLDVIGVIRITKMKTGEIYYGPPKPDLAFVHVKMKELPKINVKYDLKEIKEGQEIATAGFPMGTKTLMAPGYLHQLTPTLQKGIISAVLPFECEKPHSLMVNVMVQGGASGSPVFLPDTGDVIGILYASLEESRCTKSGLPNNIRRNIDELKPSIHSHIFSAPTNISYVVPSHYIEKMLQQLKADPSMKLPDDTLTLKEYISRAELVVRKPKEVPSLQIWGYTETTKRTIERQKPNGSNS